MLSSSTSRITAPTPSGPPPSRRRPPSRPRAKLDHRLPQRPQAGQNLGPNQLHIRRIRPGQLPDRGLQRADPVQILRVPAHTLAEYGLNSFGHKDYYDISVLEGFNVPMEFSPTTNGCTRPIRCAADITGECPNELKTPGGCHNPCTVYKTTEYCCHSGRAGRRICRGFSS
ncbi:UNVERIFIED_CONTAM: protein P21 [Sesamum calycinum]|uniref:Protein P21 n=1 Tax=Sesamum calycinum TaxID=2727403 RepID=A0AAW2M0Q0_9LAMI